MIKTFSQFQTFYANKQGKPAFSDLKSHVQSTAKDQINMLRDIIWNFKQWGFAGRKEQITLIPPYETGTIAGTAGEHTLTGTSTAWPTHVNGVSLRGQYLQIGDHLYRIGRRVSTTKLILESRLRDEITAGTAYQIYFVEYPLRWDVGGLRFVKRDTTPLSLRPEAITQVDNGAGEPIEAYIAGQSEANFGSITGTIDNGDTTMTSVSGLTIEDAWIGMAVMQESDPNIYYVIDIDASGSTIELDRAFGGSNVSAGTFLLNPAGTPLLGLKKFSGSRRLITINYTWQPPVMVDDNDRSKLPNDVAMMKGIELIATQWRDLGEGNMNEVLFRNKEFKESLKTLNFRGTPMQNKLWLPQDTQIRASHASQVRRWRTGADEA